MIEYVDEEKSKSKFGSRGGVDITRDSGVGSPLSLNN